MTLLPAIKSAAEVAPISFEGFVVALGHSVLIGTLLMCITLLTAWPIAKEDPIEKTSLTDLVLEAGNLVFLCAGITGVMVLVNNDLARAFAIGAAIALVRFRVRMEKATASGFFFALIAGMACGVNAKEIGWALALVYCALKIFVYFGTRIARRMEPQTQVQAVQAPVTLDTPASIVQNP